MDFKFFVLLVVSLSISTMADENVRAISDGNNALTKTLFPLVSKHGENLIFSPLSVHTVLSLVDQGADGTTDEKLREVLALPADKLKAAHGYHLIMKQLNGAPNVTLSIANVVYVNEGYKLNSHFEQVAKTQFLASASNINFAQSAYAARTINQWVEKETNEKIKDLISPDDLNADTRMVLVNAIYFKGNWASTFQKELTREEDFYTSTDTKVKCQMMHKTAKFNYKEDDKLDAQVIQLPYENKDVSMIIVLPREKNGIRALEERLQKYDLIDLTKGFSYLEVDLALPKFKIESKIDLDEPLKKAGLGIMFTDEANFTGLVDSQEKLVVSKVVQKAFIEVNEEGTEAAAATGGMIMTLSLPIVKPFNADHAFSYFIYDTVRKIVLFGGSLNVAQNNV